MTKHDKAIRNYFTGNLVSYVYKDELLQHVLNNKNSGLTFVSPSVAEGVDFKYDAARAQIILKRPTPNIGNPYVNAQYKGNSAFGIPKDPNYLDRVTYIEMMQMYGRIMRAEDDWGVTIVYDQAIAKSFNSLLSPRGARRVKELGLDYFVSAIKGRPDTYGFPIFDWPFNE
jgi:Rad3-related DNA helicase